MRGRWEDFSFPLFSKAFSQCSRYLGVALMQPSRRRQGLVECAEHTMLNMMLNVRWNRPIGSTSCAAFGRSWHELPVQGRSLERQLLGVVLPSGGHWRTEKVDPNAKFRHRAADVASALPTRHALAFSQARPPRSTPRLPTCQAARMIAPHCWQNGQQLPTAQFWDRSKTH